MSPGFRESEMTRHKPYHELVEVVFQMKLSLLPKCLGNSVPATHSTCFFFLLFSCGLSEQRVTDVRLHTSTNVYRFLIFSHYFIDYRGAGNPVLAGRHAVITVRGPSSGDAGPLIGMQLQSPSALFYSARVQREGGNVLGAAWWRSHTTSQRFLHIGWF